MRITFTVTTGPLAGRAFHFEGHDVFLVGRSPNAHCRFPEDDPFFSRVHFLVEINPPRCRLTDMGSRNGTFVNGRKVEVVDLANGDEIRAGHTRISVRVDGVPASYAREAGAPNDTQTDIGPPPADPPPRATPAAAVNELSDSSVLLSGDPRIPGYQLVRQLGRGNMGIVYLARR